MRDYWVQLWLLLNDEVGSSGMFTRSSFNHDCWEEFRPVPNMWRERFRLGKIFLEAEEHKLGAFGPEPLLPKLSDELVLAHIWPKVLAGFNEYNDCNNMDENFEKLEVMKRVIFINKRWHHVTKRTEAYLSWKLSISTHWRAQDGCAPIISEGRAVGDDAGLVLSATGSAIIISDGRAVTDDVGLLLRRTDERCVSSGLAISASLKESRVS